jgi:drug/metabolite transporter (DMT)-like permease
LDTKKFFTDKKVIILLASFCCLLWGSAYPAVKIGYSLFDIAADNIPSKLVFAGYRFTLAGIFVLLIALILRRNRFSFTKKNIGQIALLGLTQTSLQYIFFYIGLGYTTGVKGSIINATGTFFSVVLAHFIYTNDKLTSNKIIGCIIGFAGVMTVNFSTSLLNFSFSIKGDGFIMFSAFVASAASIYGKKITQVLDSTVVTGCQLFIGGFFLALSGYASGGRIAGFGAKSTLLLIYLAILSSAAFSLWTALLKYNKVGVISVFNFLIPVFGSVLSAIFLEENVLQFKNLFALILVCAGIILSNKSIDSKI